MIRIEIPWKDKWLKDMTAAQMETVTDCILNKALPACVGGRYWDAQGLTNRNNIYISGKIRAIELLGTDFKIADAKEKVKEAVSSLDLGSALVVEYKIVEEARIQ